MTVVDEAPVTVDQSNPERLAHLVDQRRFSLTDAYVFGLEVEALCGYRWVPTRDPQRFPLCQGCRDALNELGHEA